MLNELLTLGTVDSGFDDSSVWMDGDDLYFNWDSNGDGMIDSTGEFTEVDEWGNPRHTKLSYDSDHNGVFDTFLGYDFDENGNMITTFEANDYNQDGDLDMIKVYMDSDANGEFDTVAVWHADNSDSNTVFTFDTYMDLTGDHTPDQSLKMVGLDTNGDGEPDIVRFSVSGPNGEQFENLEMTYEEFVSLNEMNFTTSACMSSAVAGQFDTNTDPQFVSGDPAYDMELWEFQGPTGRCAIYAQKFAIEAILGVEIPIEELVAVAEANGWFNEAEGGGTVSLNMDKLLEYYGVKHEMSFDNDMAALEEALNNGQKVIVGVDSGQIWYGDENDIFSPETRADHAVEVIGIDRSDADHPMVVLNDSGSPDGCGELVPMDVFENAWNAGDAQMIVCWA